MNLWFRFVTIGLLVAVGGEVVNNFVVGIAGVSAVGNFLFAITFYAVMLSVAYRVQWHWHDVSKSRILAYMLVFGVGVGLFFNEWLLVGNHPGNPNAAHVVSQLSMMAYHTLLYSIPLLYLHRPSLWPSLRKWGVRALCLVWVASFVALFLEPEYRLAVALFFTYFIAYLGYFIYVMQKVIRE